MGEPDVCHIRAGQSDSLLLVQSGLPIGARGERKRKVGKRKGEGRKKGDGKEEERKRNKRKGWGREGKKE